MTDAFTVTPVPLSRIQKWTKWTSEHPDTRGDLSNWDAEAALSHFNIPFVYFTGEEGDDLPEGILTWGSQNTPWKTDSVFQPGNTVFVFVKFGNQRYLVVDDGGGGVPFAMVLAKFIDFGA